MSDSFHGFSEHHVHVTSTSPKGGNLSIRVRRSGKEGDGKKGLLLLHGYPQTSYIWRFVAPKLAEKYTVICTDLRGYGQSSKPKGTEGHEEYSKRSMADDQVQVMAHFGFTKFSVLAHDRGARVAHRLALDHPDKVEGMCLLDIAPTVYMYEKTNMNFAEGYWHWFYLIQPSPGPERMILADPEAYWGTLAGRATHKLVQFSEDAVKEYKENLSTMEGIHATCEDYRASATIDLDHDRADRSAGKKLSVAKLKIIWGGKGMIDRYGDVLSVWKGYAEDGVEVSGTSLDCGHYIPEEKPEELLKEVLDFF
ncbi:hydrolase [Dioszegia hungarica]|uniref:Hydrolase n=1 Tax=Dioszegia hungarica TaxID=4972 RepID=A0AA38LTE1_9TREE|nr:hydrolase [Dioszegia hungarica]KAI9634603.1 hydrolase [Dioszegia hungarica]